MTKKNTKTTKGKAQKNDSKSDLSLKDPLSNEQYQTIFDSAGDGIVYLSNTGTVVDINKVAIEYYGFKKEDIVGKSALTFISKKDWPRLAKDQFNLRNGAPFAEGEISIKTPQRDIICAYTATPLKEKSKIVGFVTMLKDVTNKVKAQEELRKSEERFQQLFDNSTDVIILVDKKGIILDVNKSAENYGFTMDSLIGHKMLSFAPKSEWPKLTQGMLDIWRGKPVQGATEVNTPIGNVKIEFSATPISEEGHITKFMTIMRDVTEQTKVLEELKKSEEKFRNLFDTAADGIMIADRKGIIVDVNKATTNYGFKKKDLIGKNMLKFVPKKYWPMLTADVINLMRGKNTQGEVEIFSPKENIFAEFSSTPIRKGGKIVGFQTILRDITDRKKATKEMKESEERYRHLFDNARDPTVIMDLKGKILDANRAIEDYGFKKEDIVGKNALNLVSKKNWAQIVKDFSLNAMGKETEGEFEIKTPKKGNVIVIYKARPIYKDGKIIANQTTMSDITARKKYETALRESEARYRFLVDNSHELILVLSYFGDILFANKRTLELIGLKRVEVRGKNMTQFIPPAFHKKAFDALMGEFYGKHHGLIELPVITKNGETRYLEFAPSSTPVYNHGKLIGVLVNASDITDRKRAEKERLELYKAREFDKLKDEFFSMTAHELKTPLTPIRLESDIWLSGAYCNLNRDQKESMTRISRNCNRLISLIDDILTIAKIEEKKLRFEIRPMDLRHIITDMGSDMKVQADDKGLYMRTNLPKKALMVRGDKSRLSQVLANLINNAIKSTKKGGITVSAKEDADFVVVSVADTGPGISEKHQTQIFQKFYRVRHKVGERYEGAGLGLAIVKYIIEQHKGDIWLESELGKGSTFYFKIPKYNKPKNKSKK